MHAMGPRLATTIETIVFSHNFQIAIYFQTSKFFSFVIFSHCISRCVAQPERLRRAHSNCFSLLVSCICLRLDMTCSMQRDVSSNCIMHFSRDSLWTARRSKFAFPSVSHLTSKCCLSCIFLSLRVFRRIHVNGNKWRFASGCKRVLKSRSRWRE